MSNEDYEGLDDSPPPSLPEPKPILIPRLFSALCRRSKRDGGSIKGQVVVLCKDDIVNLYNEIATIRSNRKSSVYDWDTPGVLRVYHPCIGGPRSSIRVALGKVRPNRLTFMSTAEYKKKRKEWFK
jgi:hypothetical protein